MFNSLTVVGRKIQGTSGHAPRNAAFRRQGRSKCHRCHLKAAFRTFGQRRIRESLVFRRSAALEVSLVLRRPSETFRGFV